MKKFILNIRLSSVLPGLAWIYFGYEGFEMIYNTVTSGIPDWPAIILFGVFALWIGLAGLQMVLGGLVGAGFEHFSGYYAQSLRRKGKYEEQI